MRKYILVIIICILFCGCQVKNDMAEIQMFAMDTFIDLKAQGENGEKALLEAEKEINRLEKLFSPTIEQSEIFTINQYAAKQTVTVSKDTFDLIEKAKEYCEQIKVGNGLDPTVEMGPVVNENQFKKVFNFMFSFSYGLWMF